MYMMVSVAPYLLATHFLHATHTIICLQHTHHLHATHTLSACNTHHHPHATQHVLWCVLHVFKCDVRLQVIASIAAMGVQLTWPVCMYVCAPTRHFCMPLALCMYVCMCVSMWPLCMYVRVCMLASSACVSMCLQALSMGDTCARLHVFIWVTCVRFACVCIACVLHICVSCMSLHFSVETHSLALVERNSLTMDSLCVCFVFRRTALISTMASMRMRKCASWTSC